MKKRLGLLLLALALTTVAFVSSPVTVEASACQEPDCFASPGCCFNRQCDQWCGGYGLGFCEGVSGKWGGCCICVG